MLLHYYGATIRWIYGSIWRSLSNKKKYKFTEYFNGPESSKWAFAGPRSQEFTHVVAALVIILLK